MNKHFLTGLLVLAAALSCKPLTYDVVVVGGGAGGTTAAIEAARGGARVLVLEETPWLGGMLTTAITGSGAVCSANSPIRWPPATADTKPSNPVGYPTSCSIRP